MRIAICHQTFAAGDAIGNDIEGMWKALRECGHDPFVLCEYNPHGIDSCKVSTDFSDATTSAIDLIIYHHSQAWKRGSDFITRAAVPVAFKFHNVTPAHFFEPFAPAYAEICRVGNELTQSLVRIPQEHIWLSDSTYNQDLVLAAGEERTKCRVAPPFTKVDRLLNSPNEALTTAETTRFLFVGRFAPNKGHLALLDFCAAYRDAYGDKFELIVVGSIDPALDGYWQKFAARARVLELTNIVKVHTHLPDALVHDLFRSAHVYLTFSEHEGFGVPIIEAQAIGLPVVGSGATAVRETAGTGQFIGTQPVSGEDFAFYAALAHRAACDRAVRESLVVNGRRNILTRFVDDVVQNAFLEPLLPWLASRV